MIVHPFLIYIFSDMEIGTCVWARESTRKGCLSANQRASQSSPKRRQRIHTDPQLDRENNRDKPGQRLNNGFQCPGGKLGMISHKKSLK